MIYEKSQEKSMPKPEPQKASPKNLKKKNVVKKVSAEKVTDAKSSAEEQNNITKKVSRAADDFKELPKDIAVAEENVHKAAETVESNDSENYLDKLLKGLE